MVATLPLTLEIGPRACAPDQEGGRHANFRMLASQIDIERLAIFLPQSGCSRNAESVKVVRPPSEALRKPAPPPIRIGRRLGPMTVVAAVIGVTMAAGALGAVSLTRSMLPAAAATKPNPLADWTATADAAHDKTYASWPSDFTTLPTVSLVVPNLCSDMHDCSVATGDGWLKTHFDPYVQWAKSHNSLAIMTFDED